MRVLVTGSSGRLAPFVIRDLLNEGHEVVLFSRKSPAPEFQRLPQVSGDITNFEDCQKAVRGGIDAIQHLAAQPWPVDHPREHAEAARRGIPFDATMRSNIMGTYYLLQAALQKNIEIFVMTGSNCALGHGYRISQRPFPYRYLPVDEQHPSDVEDSYSYSKLAGEELLASFTRAYGMRTYTIRAAGICDEEHRRKIARQAGPVTAWNDWLWCWVGSEDVASAQRLLMERARQIEPNGVFFCNGDDTIALEPSIELIRCYKPDLAGLVKDLPGHNSFLSNQHLKDVVGWKHTTSWRQYLQQR